MRTVGERLRAVRLARDLSQRELGADADVSYSLISHIERGTRKPSVRAIRRLAARLGVSPHWLETGRLDPGTDLMVVLARALRETRLRAEAAERRLREVERPASRLES